MSTKKTLNSEKIGLPVVDGSQFTVYFAHRTGKPITALADMNHCICLVVVRSLASSTVKTGFQCASGLIAVCTYPA
jgi:hypothetical protein